MDYRIWLISGYSKNRIENKIIVDLDCGHAPLLKYIPHSYKEYIGNDIRPPFPVNVNDRTFLYKKR